MSDTDTGTDTTGTDTDTTLLGGDEPAPSTPDNLDNPPPAKDAEPTENKDDNPEKSEQKKENSAPNAPENYADFNLPEGLDPDGKMIEEFVPIAKELDLNQEQAQKLVDWQSTRIQALEAAQAEAVATIHKDWADTLTSDPEIGGKEQHQLAVKAVRAFASPELRQYFDQTGLGNHPELVRMMYRIGKGLKEDTLHPGRPAPAKAKTAAQVLYPDMK